MLQSFPYPLKQWLELEREKILLSKGASTMFDEMYDWSNKNEVNDQRLETWIKLKSICVKCFDFMMIQRAKLNNSVIKGNNQIRTQFIASFHVL